jgi:hypothetical protein
MAGRRRTTQQSAIARSFGGRSGFVSEELGGRDDHGQQMSRWERSAAWLNWRDSHNHYEEYDDDDRVRFGRLRPSWELTVAVAIVLFVFGAYGAFIALLALTR